LSAILRASPSSGRNLSTSSAKEGWFTKIWRGDGEIAPSEAVTKAEQSEEPVVSSNASTNSSAAPAAVTKRGNPPNPEATRAPKQQQQQRPLHQQQKPRQPQQQPAPQEKQRSQQQQRQQQQHQRPTQQQQRQQPHPRTSLVANAVPQRGLAAKPLARTSVPSRSSGPSFQQRPAANNNNNNVRPASAPLHVAVQRARVGARKVEATRQPLTSGLEASVAATEAQGVGRTAVEATGNEILAEEKEAAAVESVAPTESSIGAEEEVAHEAIIEEVTAPDVATEVAEESNLALKEGIVDIPAASSVVEIDLGAEAVAASDTITEPITDAASDTINEPITDAVDAIDAIPEPETIVTAGWLSGTGEATSVNLGAEAEFAPDTLFETVAVDTIPESEATETPSSMLSNTSENNPVVECNIGAEGVVASDAMIETVAVDSIGDSEAISTSDKSEAAPVIERSLEAEEVIVPGVTMEVIAESEATDTASEAAITQGSEATLESSSRIEDSSSKQDDATELAQTGPSVIDAATVTQPEIHSKLLSTVKKLFFGEGVEEAPVVNRDEMKEEGQGAIEPVAVSTTAAERLCEVDNLAEEQGSDGNISTVKVLDQDLLDVSSGCSENIDQVAEPGVVQDTNFVEFSANSAEAEVNAKEGPFPVHESDGEIVQEKISSGAQASAPDCPVTTNGIEFDEVAVHEVFSSAEATEASSELQSYQVSGSDCPIAIEFDQASVAHEVEFFSVKASQADVPASTEFILTMESEMCISPLSTNPEPIEHSAADIDPVVESSVKADEGQLSFEEKLEETAQVSIDNTIEPLASECSGSACGVGFDETPVEVEFSSVEASEAVEAVEVEAVQAVEASEADVQASSELIPTIELVASTTLESIEESAIPDVIENSAREHVDDKMLGGSLETLEETSHSNVNTTAELYEHISAVEDVPETDETMGYADELLQTESCSYDDLWIQTVRSKFVSTSTEMEEGDIIKESEVHSDKQLNYCQNNDTLVSEIEALASIETSQNLSLNESSDLEDVIVSDIAEEGKMEQFSDEVSERLEAASEAENLALIEDLEITTYPEEVEKEELRDLSDTPEERVDAESKMENLPLIEDLEITNYPEEIETKELSDLRGAPEEVKKTVDIENLEDATENVATEAEKNDAKHVVASSDDLSSQTLKGDNLQEDEPLKSNADLQEDLHGYSYFGSPEGSEITLKDAGKPENIMENEVAIASDADNIIQTSDTPDPGNVNINSDNAQSVEADEKAVATEANSVEEKSTLGRIKSFFKSR